MAVELTKKQARQFITYKQGLLGGYRFKGKQGIIDFVAQAGCVQFDPVDVCGQNAQIVFQSRVRKFDKEHLNELLYKDRLLFDYFDKQLCIMNMEDWSKVARIRREFSGQMKSKYEVDSVKEEVKRKIKAKGYVNSKQLEMDQKVDWYWSESRLSRVVLESLYYQGELMIHHKEGTQKLYSLTEDLLPEHLLYAEEPFQTRLEFMKWRVLRRIGAVGLLWNKASDAWISITGMKKEIRNQIFAELEAEGEIIKTKVAGVEADFYYQSRDQKMMEYILTGPALKKRVEFIAPLDSFIWDRKLIEELFGFYYKWEIYTPKEQRKYGHYVLPVLYGDSFVGRILMLHEKKEKLLYVKQLWWEKTVRRTKKMDNELKKSIADFARMHQCQDTIYEI